MGDVSLVCGAGGALGGALVEAFVARGDRVVAADLHVDEIAPAAGPSAAGSRGGSVRAEAVDLSSAEQVEALWERLSSAGELPRFVVNAVGGFRGGRVADLEPDTYGFVHDLNLGTVLWSCRAAARSLGAGGAILNVASRTALSGGAGAAAYAVSKAAVVRLTEVLADELAERRVRVNAVLPSVIDTPANRASMGAERLQNAVPPAQIAAVAAFLCSDAAAAVTRAVVPVYGWA